VRGDSDGEMAVVWSQGDLKKEKDHKINSKKRCRIRGKKEPHTQMGRASGDTKRSE